MFLQQDNLAEKVNECPLNWYISKPTVLYQLLMLSLSFFSPPVQDFDQKVIMGCTKTYG